MADERPNSKVAIVTGASRGIGAAIARRLGADGFAVVVNYSRSEAEAAGVVREIEAGGGSAVAVRADVGEPAATPRLFDAAEQAFGGIDVVVLNAGMMKLAPIAEVDDATFAAHLSLNLGGVFRGLREGARRVRDGGRLISLSSNVIGAYPPTYGAYAATKGAVEALTRVVAKELGPRRVTVNAVAPGPVATDLFLEGKSPELVESIVKTIPLGRLGEPDDIAAVVAFLAGPDGGWVNGQVLTANGGR